MKHVDLAKLDIDQSELLTAQAGLILLSALSAVRAIIRKDKLNIVLTTVTTGLNVVNLMNSLKRWGDEQAEEELEAATEIAAE